MEDLKNVFKGIVLGVSNIIPGVSAGTMAVVMGIYDKIINSVSNIFKQFKKNFRFLFFIGIGVLVGIIFFSSIISKFLDKYPWQMNYLFMGLIAGTFGFLFKTLKSYKPKKTHYIYFAITFILLIVMEFLNVFSLSTGTLDTLSFKNIILLVVSGFLASSAMILPGVSGSFVLVLLGVYNSIITAISSFNIPVLMPFGIGVVLGFVCMVKIIEYFLKNFKVQTYMAIVGLVTGSLIAIFPGFEFSLRQLGCVIVFIFGFLVSYFLCKINKE